MHSPATRLYPDINYAVQCWNLEINYTRLNSEKSDHTFNTAVFIKDGWF